MSLLRAVAGVLASFGFLCALALIAIGVAIWPPGILLVFAAIWYGVHTWKQAKRETALRIAHERIKSETLRKSRKVKDDFDPELPSALD